MHDNSVPPQDPFQLYQPRSVKTARGVEWLANGLRLFLAQPRSWLLICVVGFGILMLSLQISSNTFANIAIGLLNHVWTAGLIIGCRALDSDNKFNADALFLGFKNNLGRLMGLGAFSLVCSSLIIMLSFYGMQDLLLSFANLQPGQLPNLTPEQEQQLLLRVLIACALYIPVAMAVWFAPALIALHDAPLKSALRLSFLACLRNMLPFLVYGVLLVFAFVAGSMLFLLGLLVVMPMFFGSIYAAYKDIFLHQQDVLQRD